MTELQIYSMNPPYGKKKIKKDWLYRETHRWNPSFPD